jgi:formylglycine-generating enzyme required for sulfatase activity
MTHDIFISYSSKDKNIVDALVSNAENNNIRCWYAPRDIAPGDDWGESIIQAISNCKIMVILFSQNSNTSRRVLDEVNYAITSNKIIIPFRVEKIEPTGAMKLHLSSVHWLDAFQPSWKDHIEELINRITKILNIENQQNISIEKDSKFKIRKFNFSIWKIGTIILAIVASIFFIINLQNNLSSKIANQILATQFFLPTHTSTFTPTSLPSPSATPTKILTPTPILTQISPNEAIRNQDGSEMVLIPEGEFLMGASGLDFHSHAYYEHKVYLSTYWIDKYPVTKEQYTNFFNDFMQTDQYESFFSKGMFTIDDDVEVRLAILMPSDPYILYEDGVYKVDEKYANHPATYISYAAAYYYCNWAGARLPTEAEWEKAARGVDDRPYPWGYDEDYIGKANINNVQQEDHAGYDFNIYTTPVDQYPDGVSPYGVYDLVGNTYEWTGDWFSATYYDNSPYQDPQGPSVNQDNLVKIFRGSAWLTEPDWMHLSNRNFLSITMSGSSIGFRCAANTK